MQKEIIITPAWDCRSSDPKRDRDYGIHGCELKFILIGKSGVCQFVVHTNWYLPENQTEIVARPFPREVGYHSRVPQYKGHEPLADDCPYLGGKCYVGGSGDDAQEAWEKMLAGGSDAVWAELTKLYIERFGEEEGCRYSQL